MALIEGDMAKQKQADNKYRETSTSPLPAKMRAKPMPIVEPGEMMFTDEPAPYEMSPYQRLLWRLKKLKEREAQIKGGVDG
jgi:hypothetical protein